MISSQAPGSRTHDGPAVLLPSQPVTGKSSSRGGPAKVRTVRVVSADCGVSFEIALPAEGLTCRWLLDEAASHCRGLPGKVVALRTTNNNETMDFYLTLGERYLLI